MDRHGRMAHGPVEQRDTVQVTHDGERGSEANQQGQCVGEFFGGSKAEGQEHGPRQHEIGGGNRGHPARKNELNRVSKQKLIDMQIHAGLIFNQGHGPRHNQH